MDSEHKNCRKCVFVLSVSDVDEFWTYEMSSRDI